MKPVNGGVGCGLAACEANLNVYCPTALALLVEGKVVGCKSACLAAKTDMYCCSGEFADPKRCKPSTFGLLFKAFCPQAYSYPYDDSTGLKTCSASRYVITFCPSKIDGWNNGDVVSRRELCFVFCLVLFFFPSVWLFFVVFVVVLFPFCFGNLLDWKEKMVCHLKFARLEIKNGMLFELWLNVVFACLNFI